MSTERRMWHRRMNRWQAFDGVTITTVPRYKTSGMSGDEWRFSATVTLWFKGVAVVERGYRDVETALAFTPALMAEESCPINDAIIKREATCCDNYGCAEPWVSHFRLKRLTANDGSWLADSENDGGWYRQFCLKHLRRGDCSREDSDANYEVIEGPGPERAQGYQQYVREAGQVAVTVQSIDEIPAAIGSIREPK